jgi:hypothetical protein
MKVEKKVLANIERLDNKRSKFKMKNTATKALVNIKR